MKKKSLFKDSIFATLFILTSIYGLSKIQINSDVVNPIAKALGDFRLTDIVFSHLRERPTVDTNIVIVNIGPVARDRTGLAELLDILNEYQPKVIGIDAFYRRPRKNALIDSALAQSFSKTKNLILVSELIENVNEKVCDSMVTSHPMFMRYAEPAFADMISEGKDVFKTSRECTTKEKVKAYYKWVDSTIEKEIRPIVKTNRIKKDTTFSREIFEFGERTIVTLDTTVEVKIYEYGTPYKIKVDTCLYTKVTKDTTFYSFPVKIASIFAPEKVKRLIQRNKEYEIINFHGNIDPRQEGVAENAKIAFAALDWPQVLNREFTPDLIKDKIVIIGYLGDTIGQHGTHASEDKFFTPLNKNYIGKANPDMYGVVIHANIVSMILAEDYINKMPEWLNFVMSILLIFAIVYFFTYLYFRTEIWYDGISTIITLLSILLLISFVIFVFHKYNYFIDITLPSVALFLTGNLIEIYFGILKISYQKFKRITKYYQLKATYNKK